MTSFRRALAALVLLLAAASSARAEEDARAQVLATVQSLFDAMVRKDAAAGMKVILPEARFFSVRVEAGAPIVRTFTIQEGLARWAESSEALLERMWSSEVRIHGRIATVWTPYDFHRDGKFSHCGIDAFDLVQTAEGWRLAGGVYTMEPEGCAASPLGPPPAGADWSHRSHRSQRQRDAQGATLMQISPPRRVRRSYVQQLIAPPSAVFPLLCPVREADWIEGWDPLAVWSASGVAEADCVFTTAAPAGSPHAAIWYVTRHEPGDGFVEMLKITPEVTACRLTIQLRARRTGRREATVTYTAHEPGARRATTFVAGFTEEHYRQFMQDWEARLNHYLRTGQALPGARG